MKNKISLAMIIQNEESFLDNCLSYHKPFFDEIIIVDGGSIDNSLNICRKYTKDIFIREFKKDFADQRNFAIEKCHNEWIFMIDADELLEESLLNSLDDIIEECEKYDVIYIPRINTIDDLDHKPWLISKYGWFINEKGWINYPDYQCRLFKKHCRFKNKVHEIIYNTEKFVALENLHIIHKKNWDRQVKQNNLYQTIN